MLQFLLLAALIPSQGDVCASQVEPRDRCDEPPACAATSGFKSVSVRPRGEGLRIGFRKARPRRVVVDVFQHSAGRRLLGNRRVVRLRRAAVWRGRRGSDGLYSVRFTMKLPGGLRDVRRVALVRRDGTFSRRPSFYRRASCGAVSSFKLERPAFNRRGLGIAFRLGAPARVRVTVTRRGKRVRGWEVTGVADRTYRLRLRARPRGDYVVRLRAGKVRARLVSRRL